MSKKVDEIMFDKFKFCGDLVNLNDKRYSNRNICKDELSMITGIDDEILNRYDNWYILDNNFYYFKYSYVFEEILMSELAKSLGVKCVSFTGAIRGMTKGIISGLYRSNDKDYYMYSEFCKKYFNQDVSNLNDLFDMLLSKLSFEDVCNFMNDIYGLIVFDLFSGQTDRLEYNFFFECGKDTVRLAPLCDNGRCFGANMMYRTPFGNYSLYGGVNNIYNDLYMLLNENKEFYLRLEKVLDIDIWELLKRTLDKYKILINGEFKNYILNYFDDKKVDVERVLKRCRK